MGDGKKELVEEAKAHKQECNNQLKSEKPQGV